MNDTNAMPGRVTVSRRDLLAGGAALAALTFIKPGWAQAGGFGSQPVVLITGTSSGFGNLMAETFARDGLRVVATMREAGGRNAPAAAALRGLAKRERLALDVVEIDVTDQESVDRGVAEALRMAGRVDVLVNNAAIAIPGPLELVPSEFFHRSFDTNVHGYHRVFAALAPQMRERGSGYIIQLSSGLGRIPSFVGAAVYNLSKAAIESMSDNMAASEAPFGIEVTVIQPSAAYPTKLQSNGQRYLTDILASLLQDRRRHVPAFASQIAQIRERLVGDRTVDPQEVADGALALIRMAPGGRPRRRIIGPRQDKLAMVNAAHDRALAAD